MSHPRHADEPELRRLGAADPVDPERLDREMASAPIPQLRRAIPQAAPRASRTSGRRLGILALVTVALLLAGGAATGIVVLRPSPAPDTPEGRALVIAILERIRGDALRDDRRPQQVPIVESAQVAYDARTPAGRYTIWFARTEGAGSAAAVLSSPVTGLSVSVGPRVAELAGVSVIGAARGGSTNPVREIYGRVSPGRVVRVEIVLDDGTRRALAPRFGWFVFSQPASAPHPVAVLGRDASGEVIARAEGPIV